MRKRVKPRRAAKSGAMKQVVNPKGLFNSLEYGFSQAVVTRGGRMVHVAGQTAWDSKRRIVGKGNLRVQVRKSLENLAVALKESGAGAEDVVRLRIYVVKINQKDVSTVGAEMRRFFPAKTPPACTLLGVQALANPEFLVEIDATAVVG